LSTKDIIKLILSFDL
jgi:atrophin-1 interacting protein 5 (WW domain-containing E3 ubiquitin protein ligase 1)